jgi:acetolactate synthase-1/2/3 large subunit
MKASDYIADYLEKHGVAVVFEMIGGMITHIIDSLHQRTKIKIVSVHHEQSAGFAAEAVGRLSNAPGVALATSGPGATNLVTAIASCYFDSTPTIFITGQVNLSELSKDLGIRQQGFQETDIVSIVKPITKWAMMIDDARDIPKVFEKAFKVASEGRPGPVLIDIPMDVQRQQVEGTKSIELMPETTSVDFSSEFYESIASELSLAKCPLILAGGGVRVSRSTESFVSLVDHLEIPVIHSLLGVDLLPYNHPMRVGMIGTYGNRWANIAMMESDFIMVLGSRLDVRQTGSCTDLLSKRKIFHIDCDNGQLNNRVKGCKTLQADLQQSIDFLVRHLKKPNFPKDWYDRILNNRKRYADTSELSDVTGINPNDFIHKLGRSSNQATVFVADVGKHQMWTAQSLELESSQRLLLSGGLGSMGFALPAAIGSAFATHSPVVCIAGDGGFQCNIQELETIAHHALPIKMIILNNKSLGMVGQFQEDYFESRLQSTVWGYSAPDFEALGNAYKISSKSIASPDEVDAALEWLWGNVSTPALLNVEINLETKVYPKAAYGRQIDDMDPPLDDS